MRGGARTKGFPLLALAVVSLGLALLLLTLAFGDFAHGNSYGPDDGYAGNPPLFLECTLCHYSYPVNSGDGSLALLNLPASYVAGSTYTLALALSDPGQMRWGFEVTALDPSGDQAGDLVVTDAFATQLSDNPGSSADFLKQTQDGTYFGTPNGSPGWSFDWVAPNAPSVTFYVAGNAADGSEEPSGDYIYVREYTILQASTPTDASSWGQIKALYRR